MAEVLRLIPKSANPDLLVGIENSDDAGVFRLSDDMALVQTVDFFTPVVDDPYAYGQIAAANSLSDVYAMGGRPVTVLNIACFDPEAAPASLWASVIQGMHDKTIEAGALVVGGHSVEDEEPKFGMAVTGVVNPARMFVNTEARVGDEVWLSKPLGTGIVTTAAKFDACSPDQLQAAVECMSGLNRAACETGLAAGVRCGTDVTGFGLAGHLFNIARASGVSIEIDSSSLPLLPGVEAMVAGGNTTAGATRNEGFLGESFVVGREVPNWLRHVALDPQTSGGLALMSTVQLDGFVRIGRVVEGPAKIILS